MSEENSEDNDQINRLKELVVEKLSQTGTLPEIKVFFIL